MKYIAYYDAAKNKEEKRNYVLAATNKMDYICKALNKIGEKVEIISASETRGKSGCKGKKVLLENGNSLNLFYSMGRGSKIKNVLGRFFIKVQMFFYLMNNLEKNEKVIVYHSLGYMKLIKLIKRLRKIYLILEMEEVYADVRENSKLKECELKFTDMADAYIFPTESLNKVVNKKNKPYTIIHGTYNVEANREDSFDDEKIHIVYAGTFDPKKGGVYVAIQAAEFLPEKYHIHILGFGSAKEVENVKKAVAGTEGVTYEGLLSGEEYISFLQKCHIGLSTQNPEGSYNETSFPSKILSYMANGLRVVSIRIPVVETSAVGDDLCYYDEQTPEKIAEAIMSVDLLDNYDGRKKLTELDKQFEAKLKKLLEG